VVVGQDEKRHFETYYNSPYFFDSNVFQNFDVELIELKKIYRQKDDEFINLLNKIRNSTILEEDVVNLNSRYEPEFDDSESGDFYITLTTTNAAADEINYKKLQELGTEINHNEAVVSGSFDKKHFPTSIDLDLRVGAQIMLLNNDSKGRWVNGSLGKIVDIGFDEVGEDILFVELDNGKKVKVGQHTWEVSRYYFNKEKNKLESEEVGSFTQYPVRLAWAVTIHKSQGKTFNKVIVDIGNGTFSHGQVYVAISRCTSFEGLVLRRPILKRHIWMDRRVSNFLGDN